MTLQGLVTVAIRLMGLAVIVFGFCSGLTVVALQFGYLMQTGTDALSVVNPLVSRVLATAVSVSLSVGVGVALMLCAPAIARVVCRGEAEQQQIDLTSVRAGEAYHIGMLLGGIYVLVRAVEPATEALYHLFSRDAGLSGTGYFVPQLFQAGILCVLAIFMIFGAQTLAAWLASLRYDPANVPAQRISLRVLLIAVTLCAILLVLFRFLTG